MALIEFNDLPNTSTPINANNLNNNFRELLDLIYPIGRVIIDETDTDYSNYLGFTWEKTLVGVVPIGKDTTQTEFDTLGKTGGEKTHTLTINEMPKHSHMGKIYSRNYNAEVTIPSFTAYARSYDSNLGTGNWAWSGSQEIPSSEISNTAPVADSGGNQPHNNLQPYKVVNYWKRIA